MASLEFSDEENEIGAGRNNEDGYRSDEAVEDGAEKNGEEEFDGEGRRIDPSTSKKRVVRNPQPKLNIERIQGPKGIQTIEKYFEGFKFHGKGHEKSDLDKIMKRLEHWAHRLFPKYQFDDFLEKMEILGRKKNVQVYLKKYRLGMDTPVVDIEDADEEIGMERDQQPAPEQAPVDEFDKLIAEQIEKQKQVANEHEKQLNTSISKPSGNVLGTAKTSGMSEEMKARIEANRQLALERKNARLRRIEEENKKRKLEESQVDSQISETQHISPAVFAPEKRDKDIAVENVESTPVVDLSAMDVLNEEPADKAAIIEEPIVDLTSDSINRDQGQHSIDLTVESLPDNRSTEEPINGNKTQNEKDESISIAETIEFLNERDNADVSTTNGTFYENSTHREEESEYMQDEMEYSSNVSKTYGSVNQKPNDDPDKLLTKEELQMEIDNAIEEIISRNAHRNK